MDADNRMPASPAVRRIDLHCHSDASNKPTEAALQAIHCPECYSSPDEVYQQAKRRGMDFVTITDHDTIAGVQTIGSRPDVLAGEELTCWFPEDECKLHLLVFGISNADHERLQSLASDIYAVAQYIEERQIAHSLAHPLYRQNEKLERWHLERLILLFKGFECLNGAHSALHREAFEPVLDHLTAAEINKLSERHHLPARWPEPWIKARTGGSDDHGLLNIGRTWTEFPADATSPADLLNCLRQGRCRPGGEAGSSAKLAHTFYSVAVRYYGRSVMKPGMKPNLPARLLQTIAGERAAPSKFEIARLALRGRLQKLTTKIFGRAKSAKVLPEMKPLPNDGHIGTGILKNFFLASARQRIGQQPDLCKALESGLPPLGEHQAMFNLACAINRDVTGNLVRAISDSVDQASFTGLFDSIAAVAGQQFVLAPYYFAVFHQNKERRLLRRISNQPTRVSAQQLKVGLFTDTLDDTNGVARFIRDLSLEARRQNRHLVVHTSAPDPACDIPGRKNFVPLLSRPMPLYPQLQLNVPPILEVLHWADQQQFDAVHISTPGPMGLCGYAVARMLRVPLLATYHTDFPAYLAHLTRDHRFANGATAYMKWLYSQMGGIFARSRSYMLGLRDMGISESRLHTLPASIDLSKFSPDRRDDTIWKSLGVAKPRRLFYCGRLSVEKNLPLLERAFKLLCERRPDVALVLAGDGPYRAQMQRDLRQLPAYFLGAQDDGMLARLYSSADLFVFPSRTDTLGQVVMEAQASGLPALVSNEGGPKEVVADGTSGLVLNGLDAWRWCDAMDELLNDHVRRRAMAAAAPHRARKNTLAQTLDAFWEEHVHAANQMPADEELAPVPPRSPVHAR